MILTLEAVLEGAPYRNAFASYVLAMPPSQASQWSDEDLETCGLGREDIQDMRARLRSVGAGMLPPLCDREAG